MPDTRYRRGWENAADMAFYMETMAEDNTGELRKVKRNLVRALKEDVTDRQRELLMMYYSEGVTMKEIGDRLGIDKSTVSRTIKRGERRLHRCLRYGAEVFLRREYD
ncbi:MAG: sigma-70 family RNA polymerase sigma factor [Oscillospiraceae bacterium]